MESGDQIIQFLGSEIGTGDVKLQFLVKIAPVSDEIDEYLIRSGYALHQRADLMADVLQSGFLHTGSTFDAGLRQPDHFVLLVSEFLSQDGAETGAPVNEFLLIFFGPPLPEIIRV